MCETPSDDNPTWYHPDDILVRHLQASDSAKTPGAYRLLGYYSLVSFVAMVVTAILLSLLFSRTERHFLLYLGEKQNIALTRAFSNALWPSLDGLLRQSSELIEDLQNHPLIPHINQLLARFSSDLEIVTIEIYNHAGITVFSTQTDQIGVDQSRNHGFLRASANQVVSEMVHYRSPVKGDRIKNRDLISSYTPLRQKARVLGVFKLDYDIGRLLDHSRRSQQEVILGVAGVFLFLYGTLFFVVRRGSLIIKNQHEKLTQYLLEIRRNEETLKDRVEERTETLKITNEVLNAEIQERQQAEAELRKLSQAVEQSPASVIIIDLQGRVQYVNPKFCQVTGYSEAEVMGQNSDILKSGVFPPQAYQHMWDVIRRGEQWHGESQNRRKDGTLFWELASVSPIRNQYGEITHYVAVKEDITEFKKNEEELAKTRQMAYHQEKMASIGTLAAGILHEINNPTAAISGILEALLDINDNSNPEITNYLEMMQAQIERMTGITREMSEFSTPQMEEVQLLDLNNLIEKGANLMRFDQRMRNIRLRLQLDRSLPAVHGSGAQLSQVVINLLLNAADALENQTNGAPEVVIATQLDHNHVQMRVADNGSGMDKKTKAQVFDAFFTTKPVGKGTGLGLSLCYAIISKHNGHMDVLSTLGKGSTFCIYLPISGEVEQAV